MANRKNYLILRVNLQTAQIHELTTDVQRKIDEGYRPQGGPFVYTDLAGAQMLAQAMVYDQINVTSLSIGDVSGDELEGITRIFKDGGQLQHPGSSELPIGISRIQVGQVTPGSLVGEHIHRRNEND